MEAIDGAELGEDFARLAIPTWSLGVHPSLQQKAAGLRDLLASRDYKYVISSGIRCDLINRLIVPRERRFVIKHEAAFTPFARGAVITGLVRTGHLAIMLGARTIVCVSEHVRQSLPSVLRRKSVVIPNGVDIDYFRPPERDERNRARAQLGLGEEEKVVVFVGSLDRRKRPGLLIPPVHDLRRRGHKVVLVIAGDGPLKERLLAAADLGGVRMLGFQNDVRGLYWAADLFVLPSTHEGMPMAAIEALACGVPVLLSDIPPHRELLEGCNNAGALFRPEDVAGMTDALSRWLYRPRTSAPREAAIRKFSAATMARRYCALLEGSVREA